MSKQKAYTRLVDGEVVWVYPDAVSFHDKLVQKRLNKRTRQETDDEVRARLRLAGVTDAAALRGRDLDRKLGACGLTPRKMIEE